MKIVTVTTRTNNSQRAIAPEAQRCSDYINSLLDGPYSLEASRVVDWWIWTGEASFDELTRASLHGGVA